MEAPPSGSGKPVSSVSSAANPAAAGAWEPLRAPESTEAERKAAANRAKGLVKVSMNFTPQTVEALRELSRKSGTTMTEVVRRSIGLQKFIAEEIEAGAKVLVEDAKGRMKQVLLQ